MHATYVSGGVSEWLLQPAQAQSMWHHFQPASKARADEQHSTAQHADMLDQALLVGTMKLKPPLLVRSATLCAGKCANMATP